MKTTGTFAALCCLFWGCLSEFPDAALTDGAASPDMTVVAQDADPPDRALPHLDDGVRDDAAQRQDQGVEPPLPEAGLGDGAPEADAASLDLGVPPQSDAEPSPDAAECPAQVFTLDGHTAHFTWWTPNAHPSADFRVLDRVEDACPHAQPHSESGWLSGQILTQSGEETVHLSVNPAALPAGRHTGTLVLPGAQIEVTLEVLGSSGEPRVLVVAVDRLGAQTIADAHTPTLDRLAAMGGYAARPRARWEGVLKGRAGQPTFLQRAHNILNLPVAAATAWDAATATDHLGEGALAGWFNGPPGVHDLDDPTAAMLDHLRGEQHVLHFLHLDTDAAGLEDALSRVMAVILDRAHLRDKAWLLVVVAAEGEGNDTPPLLIARPGRATSMLPDVDGTAIHTTVLAHLGWDEEPGWDLPLAAGLPDDVHCTRAPNGQPDPNDPNCDWLNALDCPGRSLGNRTGTAVGFGNTVGHNALQASNCTLDDTTPELRFQWTAPARGVYTISTTAAFNNSLGYTEACDVGGYCVVDDDAFMASTTLNFQEGASMVFSVKGVNTDDEGDVALSIERVDHAGCIDRGGDLGAVTGRVAQGHNDLAPTRIPSLCSAAARDAVFRWTAPSSGRYRFSTLNSNFDTILTILSDGDCRRDVDEWYACHDDVDREDDRYDSEIEIEVVQGTSYIVAISGWNGAMGQYALDITAL